MQVTFSKLVEKRVSTWEAVRGKRTRVAGPTMALGRGDLPHDLVQFIVEAAVGVRHGFWGCVADGASFHSLRRKETKPGRAVIAAHRKELDAAEAIVGDHVTRWKAGQPTPAAEPLARIEQAWRALGDGESLTLRWPHLELIRGPSTTSVVTTASRRRAATDRRVRATAPHRRRRASTAP